MELETQRLKDIMVEKVAAEAVEVVEAAEAAVDADIKK